jgi:hypothetical protein
MAVYNWVHMHSLGQVRPLRAYWPRTVREALGISLKPMTFRLEIAHREKRADRLVMPGQGSVWTEGFSAAC